MPDQVMGLSSAGFRALAACLPPRGAGLEYSGRVLLDFQHIHQEGLIPKGLWERQPHSPPPQRPPCQREDMRFCQPDVFTPHYCG